MEPEIEPLIARHTLPPGYSDVVDKAVRPLARRVAAERRRAKRPIVVGLCGSQGSGKTTFAAFLSAMLGAEGLSAATLSVDDLYMTRETRRGLAEAIPLLVTRGPPGTHDVKLGVQVLDDLTREVAPHRVAVPRFDKALDTQADRAEWPTVTAPVDVVLFEGWFVGARPEPAAALAEELNVLERDEDADLSWRRHVNAALAKDYQTLFSRLDLLVLLQAPGFEQVYAWRALQEEKLAAKLRSDGRPGEVMDEAALRRFIMHYERLTRWILDEMPARADVVIRLDPNHEVVEVRGA